MRIVETRKLQPNWLMIYVSGQVMDIVDRLFVAMFDSLNEHCNKDLEAVGKQYPFEPLKVPFSVRCWHAWYNDRNCGWLDCLVVRS